MLKNMVIGAAAAACAALLLEIPINAQRMKPHGIQC